MNENENIQDAQIVEKPVAHKDSVALEALRTKVSNAKTDFQKQIAQVREAIESRETELKNLNIKLLKLQGAVEASDLYLQQSPATK
jgi:hypothetical protein